MEEEVNCKKTAEIVFVGVLYMIVCVPVEWETDDIVQFAEDENPSGIVRRWSVQQVEPVQCAEKPGFVHVTLEA